MTSAIADCMNFHNFKKLFESSVVYQLQMCHFETHFQICQNNQNLKIKREKKVAKKLLNFCSEEGLCNSVNHLLLKTFP